MASKTLCDWDDVEIPEGMGLLLADYRPATLSDPGAAGDFCSEDCLIKHLSARFSKRRREEREHV